MLSCNIFTMMMMRLPDVALTRVFRLAADQRELAACCARLRRVRALPASASTGAEDERRAVGGVDFGLRDEAYYDLEVCDEWHSAESARAVHARHKHDAPAVGRGCFWHAAAAAEAHESARACAVSYLQCVAKRAARVPPSVFRATVAGCCLLGVDATPSEATATSAFGAVAGAFEVVSWVALVA